MLITVSELSEKEIINVDEVDALLEKDIVEVTEDNIEEVNEMVNADLTKLLAEESNESDIEKNMNRDDVSPDSKCNLDFFDIVFTKEQLENAKKELSPIQLNLKNVMKLIKVKGIGQSTVQKVIKYMNRFNSSNNSNSAPSQQKSKSSVEQLKRKDGTVYGVKFNSIEDYNNIDINITINKSKEEYEYSDYYGSIYRVDTKEMIKFSILSNGHISFRGRKFKSYKKEVIASDLVSSYLEKTKDVLEGGE